MRSRKVLKCCCSQHGRRHQNRDLFAVHHRLERGANADLRLAEAHIAADQPVHGLGAFHVGLGLTDRTVTDRAFPRK